MSVPRPTNGRLALGVAGEDSAVAWYEERGYQVMARNWRCREGELDIVLRRDRLHVFCEVKSRSSTAFGTPFEAVTHQKQVRIRRLAARWLREEAPSRRGPVRFDVVSVLRGEIAVIENAF